MRNNGGSGSPVTLTTTPGELPATIEGEFITENANYVTISHLNFKQNNTTHDRVNSTGCNPKGVKSIVFWGSNHIVFEYNDVSQASVSPDLRETAIGFNYNPTSTTDVVVRNNKIHDFGACYNYDHGIYVGNSDDGKIYNNWIWGTTHGWGV